MQLTRQHVVDVLRRAGMPDMAEVAERELPDPVDSDKAAVWGNRYGINIGELTSRMGGSP